MPRTLEFLATLLAIVLLLSACGESPAPPDEAEVAALPAVPARETERTLDALWATDRQRALSPDQRVHGYAELGACREPWVVPQLVGLHLGERDVEAQIASAVALFEYGNYAGIEALLALCGSNEAGAQRACDVAAELCVELDFETPELLAWHWENANVDGRLPPEVTSPRQRLEIWRLVAELGATDAARTAAASEVLAALGVPAAHALADALGDSSPDVRCAVAQTLGKLGPRAAVAGSALIAALDDANEAVVSAAA